MDFELAAMDMLPFSIQCGDRLRRIYNVATSIRIDGKERFARKGKIANKPKCIHHTEKKMSRQRKRKREREAGAQNEQIHFIRLWMLAHGDTVTSSYVSFSFLMPPVTSAFLHFPCVVVCGDNGGDDDVTHRNGSTIDEVIDNDSINNNTIGQVKNWSSDRITQNRNVMRKAAAGRSDDQPRRVRCCLSVICWVG